MKKFLQQLLMLGGFYFIIALILGAGEGIIAEALSFIWLVTWLVLVIVLAFRKKFVFLEHIAENKEKTKNYLIALGIVSYYALIFIIIPGAYYGYNSAMANYRGEAYSSLIPQYAIYASFVFLILLIVALIWATCLSFTKKKA